eukprot:evm.model.scf_1304.4 EVM.evm.TU.scf_1304.4   scf_1304:33407-35724(+)
MPSKQDFVHTAGFQVEAMAAIVDPALGVRGLFDLLLKPLRVLKRIFDVEEGASFLHGRAVVLIKTLEKIKHDIRLEGDGWRSVMPMDQLQGLEESLKEFAKKLEKAEHLVKRIQEYKGKVRMWIYAKGLKTSLEDSNQELDRVDQGLTQLRAFLGEAEASKNQQQANLLRRISWEGRPVAPVDISQDGLSEDLAQLSLADE